MEKSIYSADGAAFTQLLRECRRRAGMTQEELAEAIDEPQSFVSKCESGERRVDVVELRRIVAALGISLTDFAAEFERRLGKAESPGTE